MASNAAPVVDRIRIIPRPDDFLNRNVGSSGEVFFDKASDTLRLYNGKIAGGIGIAKADLANVQDSVLTTRLTNLGYVVGGSGGTDPDPTDGASITVADSAPTDAQEGELWFDTDSGVLFVYYGGWVQPSYNYVVDQETIDSFSQISVAGQPTLTADGQQALTLVAGSNIQLTTDSNSNTVTITSTASGGGASSNGFGIISLNGTATVTSDQANDTLDFIPGTGITITESNGSLTFTSTASGGVSNFSQLTDVSTSGINVSRIYETAATMLRVDNVGTSAYTFNSHYSGNNPTIYAISGTTIAFDLTLIGGHPFELRDNTLTALSTNIVHVGTDGTVSTGTNAQGQSSGVLYWRIPQAGAGTYVYQCQTHAAMYGTITVKNIATI